ncbi:MAG: transposase, partial [Rhodococcus sp. (in: high G+C Gram-positive bacteria)]
PVDPGTAPTRSHFPARAHSAWDDVVAAIDAVVAEARVNSDAARSLFGFARTGCRTEDDVDELAYAFMELGIRLDWA